MYSLLDVVVLSPSLASMGYLLVYGRYILSHFLVHGLLQSCRFSLLLIISLLLLLCSRALQGYILRKDEW
jgi:hypothetical protein